MRTGSTSGPTGYKFWSVILIIVAVLFASGCEQKKKQAAAPAPPEVVVADVIQKDVPITSEWIGTTAGSTNATIRAQVSGYLIKQDYKEGSFVKKGELLFEIDPRPLQAALDQAKGQLAQAEAQQVKTEQDVKRYTSVPKGMVAQEQVTNAIQANLVAKAAVKSAQATVAQAELNLSFTKITSPIDGIAGAATAQVGDLVGPTQGPLTTVSTVNPIEVYFPISEQEYMEMAQNGSESDKDTQGLSSEPLELILPGDTVYPYKGKFYFADREVDVKTGTIRMAALFPNPGNILRPGQFCRVRAVIQVKKGALLVPQRAVNQLQGSNEVAVVGDDNKVSIRPVQVGQKIDGDWIIDKGLQPGERVVVEGVQKVKEGQLVSVKREATPQAGSAPQAGTAQASSSTSQKE